MLAVQTNDNWGFTVNVTVPSASVVPEPWLCTEVTASEAMVAWLAWLNDAARAWVGEAFSYTWARDPTTGGAKVTLTCTSNFELDGGALICLGLDADTYTPTAVAIQPAAGSWSPTVPISVQGYATSLGAGDAEGAGATRPGVPGLGHYAPICTAIGNALDAARLSAVLADAASPRVCAVDQEHTGALLSLSLGEVVRSRLGTSYRFDVALAGVPV